MNMQKFIVNMMPTESMDDEEFTDDELRAEFAKMSTDQLRTVIARFYNAFGGLN